MITTEQKRAIEAQWRSRAQAQGLKKGTVKHARAELDFIMGAAAALHALDPQATGDKLSSLVPPIWIVNAISGRPVCEEA